MSTPTRFAGVILAGGASTRMGVDKALLEIEGRPMAGRVADALREAGCDPVVCQGGAAYLVERLGVEVVPDPEPGAGPVPAILAALVDAGRPIVVAACDLVDLDAATVEAVVDAGRHGTAPAAAATADDRLHLLSFWPVESLGPLRAAIDAGIRSYRDVLARMDAIAVPVDPDAVRNVNRPEDLASGR